MPGEFSLASVADLALSVRRTLMNIIDFPSAILSHRPSLTA